MKKVLHYVTIRLMYASHEKGHYLTICPGVTAASKLACESNGHVFVSTQGGFEKLIWAPRASQPKLERLWEV